MAVTCNNQWKRGSLRGNQLFALGSNVAVVRLEGDRQIHRLSGKYPAPYYGVRHRRRDIPAALG